MKIVKLERQSEDGKLLVSFALTEVQTQALLEFAINTLVAHGFVSFVSETEAMQAKEDNREMTLEEAMSDIMKEANPKDLPQA